MKAFSLPGCTVFVLQWLRARMFGARASLFVGVLLQALVLLPAGAATPTKVAAAAASAAAADAARASAAQDPYALVKVADGRMLAPDIARIVNRGELVVAMLASDSPPFFYMRKDELVGLEVDLAKAIAKELRVKVRFDRSPQTFNEVVDFVARQQADLGISKLSRTLARAQTIRFSEPYLRLNHALILNRVKFAELARDRPLSSVIRGYTGSLGVIADSSFADYAQTNFPNAKLRSYASWQEVLDAVRKGEVIAAYRDEFEIKRFLKSDAAASLTLRTITLKDLEDTLGIAVGVQAPTLLAFVNQFLAQSPDKFTIDSVLKAVGN